MGRGLDGFLSRFCERTVRSRWLCSFQGPPNGDGLAKFGGTGVGETPLPIPNREVKPHSADGTCPARDRESRSPPVYFFEPPQGGSNSLTALAVPVVARV